MALFEEKVFESLGHCAGVTFHEGFRIAPQLLQAPADLFQDRQFRLSGLTGFLYFL